MIAQAQNASSSSRVTLICLAGRWVSSAIDLDRGRRGCVAVGRGAPVGGRPPWTKWLPIAAAGWRPAAGPAGGAVGVGGVDEVQQQRHALADPLVHLGDGSSACCLAVPAVSPRRTGLGAAHGAQDGSSSGPLGDVEVERAHLAHHVEAVAPFPDLPVLAGDGGQALVSMPRRRRRAGAGCPGRGGGVSISTQNVPARLQANDRSVL